MANGMQPGGEAASGPDTGNSGLIPNFEELKATLDFDPFGPRSDDAGAGEQGNQEGEGQEGAGEQGQQPSPPPPPPPPASAQPGGAAAAGNAPAADPGQPPEAGDPKDRTIADLQKLIGTLVARPAPAGAQPPAQPQGQPSAPAAPAAEPESPAYNFQVPRALIEGLADPEQAPQAMSTLVNGIMNTMAKDFRTALDATARAILAQVPQTISAVTTREQQVNAAREDLYTHFPRLASVARAAPAIEAGLWQQVATVAKAQGAEQWTEDFRNQVGAYLETAMFGATMPPAGGGGAPAAPSPAAPVGRQPRKTFAAGAAAGGRPGNSARSEFDDVLEAAGFAAIGGT